MRAAGVGNFQLTLPIVVLGILLSLFAFLVNHKGVPLAAALVRQVALKTAIQKLESPIEPGIFNTEIGGYTIYVRGSDIENGQWRNIFVYRHDVGNGTIRLITSKEGRIDVADQQSELVLENAMVTSLPSQQGQGKYVTENTGEVRLAVRTKRNEMIERLSSTVSSPEELGLSELAEFASSSEGADRREAEILWQRRVLLSITPLIFSLLGSAMILRFNRGGRGFGTVLALVGLVIFYLLAFVGEQLARAGKLSALEGSLLPITASVAAIAWFSYSRKLDFWSGFIDRLRVIAEKLRGSQDKFQTRNLLVDLTTGLRDVELLVHLCRYFVLSLVFMGAIFSFFTAFELWRFAGSMAGGLFLLVRYLINLLPFAYLQLSPTAAMIAILATYVIKSRQNEIVTWVSAGQSIYRLLAPCFLATALLGLVNWEIQERVLPYSNQVQDELRTRIRSRGTVATQAGRSWVANGDRIYSFEAGKSTSDNETTRLPVSNLPSTATSASDNETIHDPLIFQFQSDNANLQLMYHARAAYWRDRRLEMIGPVEKSSFSNGQISVEKLPAETLDDEFDPMSGVIDKPSHLGISDLRQRLRDSESDTEKRLLETALNKRYTTPLLPLIIAIFTAPFALSLRRKGKAVTIGYAVALWLLFTGFTSAFEQFGLNGYLSAALAIWPPLMLFSAFGMYLLAKVRT